MDNRFILAAAAVGVPALALIWNSRRTSHPPFPPGPKRELLIGSARSFPKDRWYEAFSAWQKSYGDLVYAEILGTHIYIINTLETAQELLVKRGNIYSARAPMPMVTQVMDWEWNPVMQPPREKHTETRAVFRRAIGQQAMSQHDPIIEEDSADLVEALGKVQGDPMEAIVAAIGSIVIKISYGNSVMKAHGEELAEINRNLTKLVTWTVTQFWPVSFIPLLHYIPDWVPFPFKKVGAKGKKWQTKLRFWPWEQVMKHIEAGIASPCVAVDYIQATEVTEGLDTVRDTLAFGYAGGVDNTAATLLVFIVTMLMHPEVQKKIHDEMDQELDLNIDPTFKDKSRLTYFNAAWKEAMRLNPTTPLGVPHSSEEDDVYQGMYIPKNSTLIANVGFMCRDPRIWKEPDVYWPERWLADDNSRSTSLPDPEDFLFGFGRRICPGQYLAERMGFVIAARIMKAYTLAAPPGESVPDSYMYNDSLLRYPQGVRCQFIPRAQV